MMQILDDGNLQNLGMLENVVTSNEYYVLPTSFKILYFDFHENRIFLMFVYSLR